MTLQHDMRSEIVVIDQKRSYQEVFFITDQTIFRTTIHSDDAIFDRQIKD